MKPITRRKLLRGMVGGAVAAVGLPLFESMLNINGTSYADGTPLPKRFGQFYWGAGMQPNNWIPSTQGANWTPSPSLLPLASYVDYVTVVSGTEARLSGPGAHQPGHASMMAGSTQVNIGPNLMAVGGPTIDQIIAKAWAGQTRFASLQVAASQIGYVGTPISNAVSWVDANTQNSIEISPLNFYNTLFNVSAQNSQQILARRSILDVVLGDMQDLNKTLGTADQQRLAAHTDGIRQIELNLTQFANQQCAGFVSPGPDPVFSSSREQVTLKNKLFVDMYAIALACDLTRVFSMQFTGYKGDTQFYEINADQGYHAITHFEADARMQACVVFIMQHFAYMLEKFKATSDGAGNLLDNSLIYVTSDLSDGNLHTLTDMPVLLAGKAGGAIHSGIHYRSPGESATRVLLTIMRAMGLTMPTFGVGPAQETEALSAVLV